MTSPWLADPTWSDDLMAALSECAAKRKARLVDFVASQVMSGAVKPPPGLRFEVNLLLDNRALPNLGPEQAELIRQITDETEVDTEALLTDGQRQAFREAGLRALFLHLDDGMWKTAFLRKLNGLPAIGHGPREHSHEFFCSKPFESADIDDSGALNLCSALWLLEDAGDHTSGTFMDGWNSRKAQAIRQSILNGSYSHCLEQHCSHLRNKTLPRRGEVTAQAHVDIIQLNRTILDQGRSITFGTTSPATSPAPPAEWAQSC